MPHLVVNSLRVRTHQVRRQKKPMVVISEWQHLHLGAPHQDLSSLGGPNGTP
jgi:hypothetical protein